MKYSRPHFLAIGPEKTATSWLHSNLALHDDIFMPPVKEVGYLWAKIFVSNEKLFPTLRSNHWYYSARKRYCVKSFRVHMNKLIRGTLDIQRLAWDTKYIVSNHTDFWYCNLFPENRTTGDITPKYSEFDYEHIKHIRSRFDIKQIIITLRDPVEREWSRAKMNACAKLGRNIKDISHDEWLWNFNNGRQVEANNYAVLYDRWADVFGEDNILIVYFDDIHENSFAEINRILKFLNLEQLEKTYTNRINTPVYKGIENPVPDVYQEYLYLKHKQNIIDIAARFPDHIPPQKWLKKYLE